MSRSSDTGSYGREFAGVVAGGQVHIHVGKLRKSRHGWAFEVLTIVLSVSEDMSTIVVELTRNRSLARVAHSNQGLTPPP